MADPRLAELTAEISDLARCLAELMIEDGFSVFHKLDLSLDDATPSVSLTYGMKSGQQKVKVSLSIELLSADNG